MIAVARPESKVEGSGKKTAGRQKGTTKTGGRVKGTPNKRSQNIHEQLKALDCDPIEGMAKIAEAAMKEADYTLAGNMYKELAQYIAPKRKAIEVSGVDGDDIGIDGKFTIEIIRPENGKP